MEAILRRLYHGCGVAAGFCVFLIAFSVVLEIILRFFGTSLPGIIELATFALVGASFLALADTFRHNVHIRINIIIRRLAPERRRSFELGALAVSAAASAWLSFYSVDLTWDAYVFGDMSDGLMAIPLWIPQAMMSAGIVLMTISMVEEFIKVLRRRKPIYLERAETARSAANSDEAGSVHGPGR